MCAGRYLLCANNLTPEFSVVGVCVSESMDDPLDSKPEHGASPAIHVAQHAGPEWQIRENDTIMFRKNEPGRAKTTLFDEPRYVICTWYLLGTIRRVRFAHKAQSSNRERQLTVFRYLFYLFIYLYFIGLRVHPHERGYYRTFVNYR